MTSRRLLGHILHRNVGLLVWQWHECKQGSGRRFDAALTSQLQQRIVPLRRQYTGRHMGVQGCAGQPQPRGYRTVAAKLVDECAGCVIHDPSDNPNISDYQGRFSVSVIRNRISIKCNL